MDIGLTSTLNPCIQHPPSSASSAVSDDYLDAESSNSSVTWSTFSREQVIPELYDSLPLRRKCTAQFQSPFRSNGYLHPKCKGKPRSQSTPPALRTPDANEYHHPKFPDIYRTISDGQIDYERCNTVETRGLINTYGRPEYPVVLSEDHMLDGDSHSEAESETESLETFNTDLSPVAVDYLATQILQQWANQGEPGFPGHSRGEFGSYAQGSQHTKGANAAQNQSHQTFQNPSKRTPDEPGDGNEDEDRHHKRWRPDSCSVSLAEQSSVRLLACPFNKYDPQRFSDRNTREMEYRLCSSCYSTSIPRLKQHLYRKHRMPKHYCGSCYTEFTNRIDLDEHIRQRPPCLVTAPRWTERMTEEQYLTIKQRNPGRSPEEKWFWIYSVLFPAAIPPRSCYVDEDIESHVQGFLGFLRREARPILEAGLVSAGVVESSPQLRRAMDEVLEYTITRFTAEINGSRGAVEPALRNLRDTETSLAQAAQASPRPCSISAWALDAAAQPHLPQSPSSIIMEFSPLASPPPAQANTPVPHLLTGEHPLEGSPIATWVQSLAIPSPMFADHRQISPARALSISNSSVHQFQPDQQALTFDYFNLDPHSLLLQNLQNELAVNEPAVSGILNDFQLGFAIPRTPTEPVQTVNIHPQTPRHRTQVTRAMGRARPIYVRACTS